MARFTETEQIRSAPTIQFDPTSLVARLDAFGQQQSQRLAQANAEKAFAKGQESFQEGEQPQFKKETFFGSVSAKNYNKGLRAAYLASLDRDNREEIARIAAENPNDLSKFNDEVESYKKSTLASIDPSVRQLASDSLESLISPNRIRVQTNEIEKTHKENALEVSKQIEAATSDAMGFARDGDTQAAAESALVAFASVQNAVDAGFLSEEQGKSQRRAIERGLVEQGIKGGVFDALDSEGIRPAYDKLIQLQDDRPKGFTPEEWDKFLGETQTELNRRVSRLEKESVADAKRKKLEADFEGIQQRIDGDDSVIINPKSADLFYKERVTPVIENMPPQARQAVQATYIDRLKLVPDTMVKQITNAANSDNPDLLAEAASLIDRIDEIPGVVNKVPTEQQAYVQTVSDLMQNMEPAEAVELARKATDPKDKKRIEAVDDRLKEILKDDPEIYLDRANDAFASIFTFGDPVADEVSEHKMSQEYQSIAESFMRAGTTEADAFSKADKYIQRTWGESRVLGEKTIMKYPPEDYYAIDGDISWIQPQLMKDISEEVAGVKPDKVFLMSNDITARTATTGKPSYSVKVMIDGVFFNLEDNWQPDFDGEVNRRNEQKIEDALAERERRLSGEVDVDNIARGVRGL